MSIDFLKKYDIYFVIMCLCFSLSGILGYLQINATIRVLIFPLLLIYYFKDSIGKNIYLLSFLILFIFAEICYALVVVFQAPDIIINIGNSALILGYISLIGLIVSKLNLKELTKRFLVQIIILIVVGLYLFLELNSMVNSAALPVVEYSINVLYNLVILILLGLSLLNYFYHDSILALKLLIACAILIFSEFVQTAFYFMGTQEILSKIYIILLAISYFSFFLYIKAFKKKRVV